MQIYMLRRDPSYRTVAEKIFFKLVSKFPNDDSMRNLLIAHSDEAIGELAIVDNLIKTEGLNKGQNIYSPRSGKETEVNEESFEMQLQLHYLFKHLLILARGKRQGTTAANLDLSSNNLPEDKELLMGT